MPTKNLLKVHSLIPGCITDEGKCVYHFQTTSSKVSQFDCLTLCSERATQRFVTPFDIFTLGNCLAPTDNKRAGISPPGRK